MAPGYHPYPRQPIPVYRRPQPLALPEQSWLTDAFGELTRANSEGRLLTWDHGLTNTWTEVFRAQRVSARGATIDVAASGFKTFWPEAKSTFFCPHTRKNRQPYKPLILRLRAPHEGGTADYFQATDHSCLFRVVVKPLRETQTLLTWEDQRAHQEAYNEPPEDDTDDENDHEQLAGSQASSRVSAWPSSSQGSSSSISSASTALSHPVVKPNTRPHPRWSVAGPMGSPRRVPAGTRVLRSYYGLEVANARKTPDVDIMEYIVTTTDLFAEDPSVHPAWDRDHPHPVLEVYDYRLYPSCRAKSFDYNQFVGQPTGQVIREMHSLLGIPYSDYATLIRQDETCHGCLNHFSPHGYRAHISEDSHCTNHPDLLQVGDCAPAKDVYRFRSFRNEVRPSRVFETLDSPTGLALLQWNSRLGVPADVWMVVSTAIVHCKDCDLVRSFAGHLHHLGAANMCTDPGQSLTPRAEEDGDQ
ncbi:hypothetical protein B0H19DRAFT_1271286 [Mycena capillaripes]|nr:hypothetical protein B0H19DRAFT_1271286 [Mycena capillaripes]